MLAKGITAIEGLSGNGKAMRSSEAGCTSGAQGCHQNAPPAARRSTTERSQGARLVFAHQAAIADHVGCEDSGKPAVNFLGHGCTPLKGLSLRLGYRRTNTGA